MYMKMKLPRHFPPLLAAAALALAAFGPAPALTAQENVMNAAAVTKGGHFIQTAAFDLPKILPVPPAADSLAGRADLETVLQVQAARTPEQAAWAKLADKDTVFSYASALGSWFKAESLPHTAAFLKDVSEDANAVGALTKKFFSRARPSQADPRVTPCLDLPTTASYPSGHATRAYVWAAVLAEIFPEKKAELYERARAGAWSRILGGVHYPTDLEGGRRLAEALIAELDKSEAFRAGVKQCREEAEPLLKKG